MSEKVDVAIVGAGLAGLGAAFHLAPAGLQILVVERGDYPGSKNVTGGRLYIHPTRPYFAELFGEDAITKAPVERPVVRERLTMMGRETSTTLDFHSGSGDSPVPQSFTVLRSVFDRWLSEVVSARGAMVVPGYKVDDLMWEGDRVAGIVSAGDEIRADVVLAADGALSFIAERAGLRGRHVPEQFAMGMKALIELPSDKIEERFGLMPGEGAAQLFFGTISEGMMGGGFLYTNRESLSVGLVLGLGAMLDKGPSFEAHQLLDAFLARPEIAAVISGGTLAEYSAHAIPEASRQAMPRLVRDGLLVAGDAAGLSLNMGILVRGMEFALVSGALAARTILQAKEEGNFTARSLGRYESMLRDSFILKDHATFARMAEFLHNPRLYELYPEWTSRLMRSLFSVGEGPKQSLWKTVIRSLRGLPLGAILRDVWNARRL